MQQLKTFPFLLTQATNEIKSWNNQTKKKKLNEFNAKWI